MLSIKQRIFNYILINWIQFSRIEAANPESVVSIQHVHQLPSHEQFDTMNRMANPVQRNEYHSIDFEVGSFQL